MGVGAGQYEYFTMLRKRVLDVAVKEINAKSDIVVSYGVEKEGRKYTAIVFSMKRKADTLDENDAESAIREKLKSFGLSDNVVETLLENHDESYLWINIAVVEEQYAKGKVKNVAGYLVQAFADDYSQQKKAIRLEKKDFPTANSPITSDEKSKKQFEEQRRVAVRNYLDGLTTDEHLTLESVFTSDKSNDVRYKSISKTRAFCDPMIQSIFYRYVASEYLPEKWHSFESFKATVGSEGQVA